MDLDPACHSIFYVVFVSEKGGVRNGNGITDTWRCNWWLLNLSGSSKEKIFRSIYYRCMIWFRRVVGVTFDQQESRDVP